MRLHLRSGIKCLSGLSGSPCCALRGRDGAAGRKLPVKTAAAMATAAQATCIQQCKTRSTDHYVFCCGRASHPLAQHKGGSMIQTSGIDVRGLQDSRYIELAFADLFVHSHCLLLPSRDCSQPTV